MAAGPGAGEQENGNAPNFYKLLRPLLQRQQPSRCARARISGQSLVTSNYNLRQGGRWGGGKPDSAPSTDIPCHPSPLHPGVAQGHLLPTDMPIWDGELRGIASLFLPWTRTWGTSGPFSFQERARSSLPSTFGHLAGPAAPGTRAPQSHSVPEPAPQFPALQEQFQDSF